MATMQIEIIKVSRPEKVKKYEVIEVTYKDLSNGGKVSGKKLVSFGDYKHVYDEVKNLKDGDQATVKYEKIGEYWTWVAIELGGSAEPEQGNSPLPAPAEKAAKQQWVPDEVKQRLIIRQSCLAQAVALEKDNSPTIEIVLNTASKFVDWVFEVEQEEAPKAKRTKKADKPVEVE